MLWRAPEAKRIHIRFGIADKGEAGAFQLVQVIQGFSCALTAEPIQRSEYYRIQALALSLIIRPLGVQIKRFDFFPRPGCSAQEFQTGGDARIADEAVDPDATA